MNILVFDIGTTSMRGILYDQTGKELLQVSRLTPLIFKDEYIEQNPLFLKEQLFSIAKEIAEKDQNLKGKIETQGTTPRRYTDLIGSLCDLTSGSGDKGTPVVFIQGYFDNFAD